MHIPLILYLKSGKGFLYTVFGFTKPIKRPSEMNSAPAIDISLHNTVLEDDTVCV